MLRKRFSAAVVLTLTLAANVFAQEAVIPVRITSNTPTAASVSIMPNGQDGIGVSNVNVPHVTDTDITIQLTGTAASVLRGQRSANAPVAISYGRSGATLRLPPSAYANADISLYSLNGRRMLRNRASAACGSLNISRANVAPGVYLLSVRGVNGSSFSSRLSHNGGRLNINVAFAEPLSHLGRSAAVGDPWTITATAATGYTGANGTASLVFTPEVGRNPRITINFSNSSGSSITIETPPPPPPPPCEGDDCPDPGDVLHNCDDYSNTPYFANFTPLPAADFTETGVPGQSFTMKYVAGGSFSMGGSVSASVSPYFIMEPRVSTNLWRAVMGTGNDAHGNPIPAGPTNAHWYQVMEFACKLSTMTGKRYRLMTEAEFEYAAHNITLTNPNNSNDFGGMEWAYDSWEATLSSGAHGGADPIGPCGGVHTQKTRRNASIITGDWRTGREIRSIEGSGHHVRLTLSQNVAYPPGYIPPCLLEAPEAGPEPTNSYRDMRWVTNGDSRWENGAIAIGTFNFRAWEDGTATLGSTNGQWFTSNNIALIFVPNSGSPRKFPYIFVDANNVSIISETSFMSGGFIGRSERKPSSSPASKPNVTLAASAEALARAQTNFATEYRMIDMTNIPASARGKDSRLLDGTGHGWFQNNMSQGASHHYRKDIDEDNFRFANNVGSRIMLASGSWFTVNNTYLRVTHSNGYTVDYLYTIVPASGSTPATLYHNSFVGYERGDFRMFERTSNTAPNCSSGDRQPSGCYPSTCSTCAGEIPMGAPMRQSNDQSTFTPAPCPPGGCN